MAYLQPYPHSLGLDVSDLITKGGPAVAAAGKVIQDPGLPEITCHLLRLNKITEGKDPGPPCPRPRYTTADKRRGVGLSRAATPLRAVVWARERPVAAIGIGIATVGLLVGIGYYWGRKKR